MNERIAQALTRLFDRYRIIFWYDAKRELRSDFETLALPGVEKLEISNNEYSIKYRILREEPEQKFLLYHEGPQPSDIENWLLDVQLSHGEFRTDQTAIWLSELNLGLEFAEVVQQHEEFFRSAKRKETLKQLLDAQDTFRQIQLKMLAVASGSEPRLDSVAENLLEELADERDEKMRLITRCSLDTVLWDHMKRVFGYSADEPGIHDFVIELFKSCYAMGTDGQVKLTGDALVFLKRWKDSRRFETGFEHLSNECAQVLNIEEDLASRDLREVVTLDYFSLIDQKVISELVHMVIQRTVPTSQIADWIRQRRQSHWFAAYQHVYEATHYAAQFKHTLHETALEMNSVLEGVERYSSRWFTLDQLYRKFTYHKHMANQASLLGSLDEQIQNLYANTWLLKLGDTFQGFVDRLEKWDAPPIPLQRRFFERFISPFIRRDHKVCVILSDAMRYEVGAELLTLIQQEDRYSAELEPMISMLPSYTQLGMAALLPNKELFIADDESGTVLVDGKSSQGTVNRGKILSAGVGGKSASVISASDFLAMPREGDEGYRNLFSSNDVVYIYHNRIDAAGDKRSSEAQVFEAVEQTLHELVHIIRKLSTANATHMIVTADHGFIYQDQELHESDFAAADAEGTRILYRDRRFVFGSGLKEKSSLRKFTSAQLGLAGSVEVQIPKSINRLRVKGSGSRFVHGGASLQEIVIPVLKIHKKRQSDIATVEVDIIRGASSVITSGQAAVILYQTTAAAEKMKPRVLRAGIFTESGELISDSHELTFDLTSENPRDREIPVRFMLTRKADEANGQEVILKLEEKHAGTSHYKEYKSIRYIIRRSFTSDFDL